MRRRKNALPLSAEAYREEVARRAWEPYPASEPPQHWNCGCTIDPEYWGSTPHANAIEVITDPLDQRGLSARRIN